MSSKKVEKYTDLSTNEAQWLVSRKTFVRTLALSGIALQLPWLSACSTEGEVIDTAPLNSSQYRVLRDLQEVLFPDDGNGPGAKQINADKYFIWVMKDPLLDPADVSYFTNNIDNFVELCNKKFNSDFSDLSFSDKNGFVALITKQGWGKNWLSRIITLIFEAALVDPSYGSNPDGIVWEWLEHDPGHPRPTSNILYPKILALHEV